MVAVGGIGLVWYARRGGEEDEGTKVINAVKRQLLYALRAHKMSDYGRADECYHNALAILLQSELTEEQVLLEARTVTLDKVRCYWLLLSYTIPLECVKRWIWIHNILPTPLLEVNLFCNPYILFNLLYCDFCCSGSPPPPPPPPPSLSPFCICLLPSTSLLEEQRYLKLNYLQLLRLWLRLSQVVLLFFYVVRMATTYCQRTRDNNIFSACYVVC